MDDFNLERFVKAQDGVFEAALSEVRKGRKTSHWMWFVFPQVQGLGTSTNARLYAIGALDEARAYVAHPVLGPRLRAITKALQDLTGVTAENVFGSVDTQKLRSSLTLFAAAAPGETIFRAALDRWFDGKDDQRTLEILNNDSAGAGTGP